MKLREGFLTHTVDGTQMMVAAGKAAPFFHGLVRSNETAAFIVDCLKQETTEGAIVDVLCGIYAVSRETAARDVARILEKLRSIHALEETP